MRPEGANVKGLTLLGFLGSIGFVGAWLAGTSPVADVHVAESCTQRDVKRALDSANTGDTVRVPAGNCSWSGFWIEKAVHLEGAGAGQTRIAVSRNRIRKQSSGVIRLSGFAFAHRGRGDESEGFLIDGSWQDAEPIIFHDNEFEVSEGTLFRVGVPGGLIVSGNRFSGGWDDSFFHLKDDTDAYGSWSTPATMGMDDPDGKLNIYIEDNVFYGGTNGGVDADAASRVVYRFNALTYSSFNSHGKATSIFSVRHWEIYNNKFMHQNSRDQIANQNWAIWIRGGTGVIFDNHFDDLAGSWGDKAEVRFSLRGAEDNRPQGSCSNTRYPVPQQLGQGHDGSSPVTDPIYMWDNAGTLRISTDWGWGNPCGFEVDDFFRWGRDAFNGRARPGYVPYTHPHPLVAEF
jgi:hypothetical protein